MPISYPKVCGCICGGQALEEDEGKQNSDEIERQISINEKVN